MKHILECDFATPENTIGMGNPTDTSGDMISLATYIKGKNIKNNVKKYKNKH